jgi:hypothetical protein
MKIGRPKIEKEKSMQTWKPWFAWHPVNFEDGQTVWFEVVERKYVPHSCLSDEWMPKYRKIEKMEIT